MARAVQSARSAIEGCKTSKEDNKKKARWGGRWRDGDGKEEETQKANLSHKVKKIAQPWPALGASRPAPAGSTSIELLSNCHRRKEGDEKKTVMNAGTAGGDMEEEGQEK